jgi:hypothetical protein
VDLDIAVTLEAAVQPFSDLAQFQFFEEDRTSPRAGFRSITCATPPTEVGACTCHTVN